MTDWIWPNSREHEYDRKSNIFIKIAWQRPTFQRRPTWFVISSGVLLTSLPDIFFLVEERSDGASEAWAGVPASASLQAGAGALSKADRANIFFGFVNVSRFH